MKNVLNFASRIDRARGIMLRLCLLCLVLAGGNKSLQAKNEGKKVEKTYAQNSLQQKELLLRGLVVLAPSAFYNIPRLHSTKHFPREDLRP